MGTYIRLLAERGDETKSKDWKAFKNAFQEEYGEHFDIKTDEDTYMELESIHVPYSSSSLSDHTCKFTQFKGTGIQFMLWCLEFDPDEEEVL